jgi:GT2 family glycosyltransferase
VLVTPARNEAAHIGATLDSVVAQTVRPLRWVVVDDGSTDGTGELVRARAAAHGWIELVQLPRGGAREFSGKVRAFEAGRARLEGLGYELIGNLDADITLGPGHFEGLLGQFARDPSLGVAGSPYAEDPTHPERHAYAHPGANLEHVSGACQVFRRSCYEAIGGYRALPGGGIDTAAGLAARALGWRTRTFTEHVCLHHRPVGTAEQGRLRARFGRGVRAWRVGGHPAWEALRALADMRRAPFVLFGAAHLAGYAWAAAAGVPRVLPPELVALHRREQMQRLRAAARAQGPGRGGEAPGIGGPSGTPGPATAPRAPLQVAVSHRGQVRWLPAAVVQGCTVVVSGTWWRHGRVHEENWVDGESVTDPAGFVQALSRSALGLDLCSFRLPESGVRPSGPHCVHEEVLACIDTRDPAAWWAGVPQQTRKNVRRAERRGLVVREAVFDDALVRGIQRIYNETPVRQGRPFWHHGKDFATVQRENATYLERAGFLGAYVGEELVGFLKWVRVGRRARIMQILALVSEQDRRPTMALIAHAVQVAHAHGLESLVYDRMVYGNKAASPMTEFKRRMGFRPVAVPHATVALTWRGRLALALGVHRPLAERLPGGLVERLLGWRRAWIDWRQRLRGAGGEVSSPGEEARST